MTLSHALRTRTSSTEHHARENHLAPTAPPDAHAHDSSERGGARLSMLMTVLVVAAIGYGISTYAPIAYRAAEYKDEMQKKVDQAAAANQSGEWVSAQLRAAAHDYDIPADAQITTSLRNGRIEAAVRYTRPIPLPGYIYDYEFEHTARSSAFFKQ